MHCYDVTMTSPGGLQLVFNLNDAQLPVEQVAEVVTAHDRAACVDAGHNGVVLSALHVHQPVVGVRAKGEGLVDALAIRPRIAVKSQPVLLIKLEQLCYMGVVN